MKVWEAQSVVRIDWPAGTAVKVERTATHSALSTPCPFPRGTADLVHRGTVCGTQVEKVEGASLLATRLLLSVTVCYCLLLQVEKVDGASLLVGASGASSSSSLSFKLDDEARAVSIGYGQKAFEVHSRPTHRALRVLPTPCTFLRCTADAGAPCELRRCT